MKRPAVDTLKSSVVSRAYGFYYGIEKEREGVKPDLT